MKKSFFAAMLLICIPSFAQQKKEDSDIFHIYWGFGLFGQTFSNLNSRIANHPEYEQLKSYQGGFVLGWVAETDKAVINFDLSFASSASGNAEKKSSNLVSYGVAANFGYNFSKNKNIRFYPLAGAGVETFQATLNKDLSAIPFDSVLQSSSTQQKTNSVIFLNRYFTYRLGAELDFFNKKHHNKGLGVRAGYVGGFSSRDWRINDDQILFNAPKDNLSRWFLSAQLMLKPTRWRKK